MVVMERMPGEKRLDCPPLTGKGAELRVARKDITFHDSPGNKVRIEVKVSNSGEEPSEPTSVRLESAPLGAFLRWRPLTRLEVPVLEPGESIDLSTEIERPLPAPLGDFGRVPPSKLIAAVASPDQPGPQTGGMFQALRRMFGRRQTDRRRGRNSKISLAPDAWDVLGRRQTHWAGNVNVFIGNRAVERHVARALRVYPGVSNMTMFFVGDGVKPDAYAFRVAGLAPDWKAALHDMTCCKSLLCEHTDAPIPEAQWVKSVGPLLMMLFVEPPDDCREGKLEVNVTRRSSGQTAIVEFDLDPRAQGPGCYTI